MEYIVAFGGPDELAKEVNNKMKDGWEPQGGVSVMHDSLVGCIAFQAMTKRKGDE